MNDYGRRIVVDLEFEAAVGATSRAIREEGLQTLARIDVRDHFWRELGHDFRRYFLIQTWSPELAFEVVRHNLDAGAVVPATFAIYELADGESAVLATQPFASLVTDRDWRREVPELAAIADRESDTVARVLARLQGIPPVENAREVGHEPVLVSVDRHRDDRGGRSGGG